MFILGWTNPVASVFDTTKHCLGKIQNHRGTKVVLHTCRGSSFCLIQWSATFNVPSPTCKRSQSPWPWALRQAWKGTQAFGCNPLCCSHANIVRLCLLYALVCPYTERLDVNPNRVSTTSQCPASIRAHLTQADWFMRNSRT